jgi:putative transcriptional regulator
MERGSGVRIFKTKPFIRFTRRECIVARAKKKTRRSGLTRALLETAEGMRKSGLLDRSTYDKITLRHLGPEGVPKTPPMSGSQIRALRERARMSQAVFARHLNLTVGYVSQLERGAKQPTGATLALLNVIRRKGMEAIL